MSMANAPICPGFIVCSILGRCISHLQPSWPELIEEMLDAGEIMSRTDDGYHTIYGRDCTQAFRSFQKRLSAQGSQNQADSRCHIRWLTE